MTKKKKILITIIIMELFLIGILVYHNIQNRIYSLDNVKLLLSIPDSSSNLHIEYDHFEGENETLIGHVYINKKDEFVYTVQKDATMTYKVETFVNKLNKKVITIIHDDKKVICTPLKEEDLSYDIPFYDNFFIMADTNHATYQYHGKRTVDGKRCIKVSLTKEYSNQVTRIYYYIDLDDNNIIKYEEYTGSDLDHLKKSFTETYRYDYNIVTYKNILNFDMSNYPGYDYIVSTEDEIVAE